MSDIDKKIRDIEAAIAKTNSWKCKRDLNKYLKRLRKEKVRANYESGR